MRGKMREKTMIEKKVMDWNFEKKNLIKQYDFCNESWKWKYLVKKRQPNQNRDLFVLDNKKSKNNFIAIAITIIKTNYSNPRSSSLLSNNKYQQLI